MTGNIVKRFKNLSFRRKLFFSYIVVVIIPIIVLGFFSYYKAKSYLYEQQKMSMNESISQVASSMNEKLRRQDEFINFISFNVVLREVLEKQDIDPFTLQQKMNDSVESAIWYYLSINREIKKLSIYSEERTLGIGSFIDTAANVKDEPWYPETKKSQRTCWRYEDGELFATHSILNKDNNRILGAVSLKLDMDDILEDIKTSNFKKYGFVICDAYGSTIAARPNFKLTDAVIAEKVVNSKKNNIKIGSEQFIVIKCKMPTPGWTLYGYIPESKATVDTSGILKITASVILACLILLIVIIWLFSRTFVNRITNLNNKIEIVETGDLNIEVSSESRDEIGQLTNKFGRMLKKINSLITEVYQSKIDHKEALLKSLQAQINPHFLYNSLSMINWKAIDAGEMEISEITKLLSRFYRTTLNKGKSIISVRDEFENIKAYIDIQLLMHDNEFEVLYEIDDEIFGYEMVNFILQPIVENAILHGLDESGKENKLLKITGCIHGDTIKISVEDNGRGIDKNMVNELLEKDSNGYGLKNISERIRLYFGQEYGIIIESETGRGTQVTVTLPAYKSSSISLELME